MGVGREDYYVSGCVLFRANAKMHESLQGGVSRSLVSGSRVGVGAGD